MSADGSKLFFTAPDPNAQNRGTGCWKPAGEGGVEENAPQLYMRSGNVTTELSLPGGGGDPCHPALGDCHPATFVGASADGSKVFFLSSEELTSDDAGIHDEELYMYDTSDGHLTRISAGESGHAAADVQKVPAISADGSAVYFTTAGEKLTGNAPTAGTGKVELYRYDTNAPAPLATKYVVTLGERDYYPTFKDKEHVALLPEASWYATSDGRYLLFATSAEIPAVDYKTLEADGSDCPAIEVSEGSGDHHCSEVYRYDSASGEIVCVSCNPSGAAPVSNALFGRSALVLSSAGPVRAMSDDGSEVFFETADPLVPQDTNGTLDVYEWEARETGGCGQAGGCVHLISSGVDEAQSFFLGASPDGANVFFGTHAQLVPQDKDTYGDVYDARVCTVVDPCIKPPVEETGQCEGDACQSPPPAPIDATPGSLTFAGAGNASPSAPKLAVESRPASRAQLLARALKTCRKAKGKARKACEQRARKKYGPKKPSTRKGR